MKFIGIVFDFIAILDRSAGLVSPALPFVAHFAGFCELSITF